MGRELVVAIHDLLVDAQGVVVVERRVARKHFEDQHAQRPPVDELVVALALDDLWSQVLRRAAEGVGAVADDLGKAEVGDLDVSLLVDEEVLRLEVSVGDVHGVEVLECEHDLGREEEGDVVGEAAFPPQESEELPAAGVIEEHEHVGGRLEGALEVHDEGVVDRLEDLLLRLHVLYLLQPDDLALLQALQSQWLRLRRLALVLHQPYSAEGACAEGREELEVVEEELALVLASESGGLVLVILARRLLSRADHRVQAHHGLRRLLEHLQLTLKLLLLLLERQSLLLLLVSDHFFVRVLLVELVVVGGLRLVHLS